MPKVGSTGAVVPASEGLSFKMPPELQGRWLYLVRRELMQLCILNAQLQLLGI